MNHIIINYTNYFKKQIIVERIYNSGIINIFKALYRLKVYIFS